MHLASYHNLIVPLATQFIHQLNDMKLFIPVPHLMDTVWLLAKRNDVMRTELVLLLARENLSKSPFTHHKLKRTASDTHASSRFENLHLPLEKLVSFAISKFAEESSMDKTLKLWKRLSKFGCKGDQVTVTTDRLCSRPIISYHIILYHTISYRIISCHVMSCHII